jgi:hypothetical protein
MKSQGEEVARLIMERESLMRRLHESGIGIVHSRLRGTMMRLVTRNGVSFEPFSSERARELLAETEPSSRLDIANARMRLPEEESPK